MRHSKGAASLLSTVFAFRYKSVVGANVFDPINEDAILHPTDVGAIAPSDNNADAGILSPVNPTRSHPAIDILKQKCKAGDEGCILGKIRATNSGADIGILPPPASAAKGTDVVPSYLMTTTPSTCAPENLVDCYNGFVRYSNPAKTCAAECGVYCCTDPTDCQFFTGKVCKDGKSCTGGFACYRANILSVVKSCTGNRVCVTAGNKDRLIGSIADSCIGDKACHFAAAFGGSIGSVTNSCNRVGACYRLGGDKGKIGNLVDSCIGNAACIMVAQLYGSIASMTNSCNGVFACDRLGSTAGTVSDITNSCTAVYSCYHGAGIGGVIGKIANSCTETHSCSALGQGVGKVGHVTDSCTGYKSCMNAGKNRGLIGGISASRNADAACESAGYGSTGAITSNLMGCCNTPYVCQSATQTTLPSQCNSKVRQK